MARLIVTTSTILFCLSFFQPLYAQFDDPDKINIGMQVWVSAISFDYADLNEDLMINGFSEFGSSTINPRVVGRAYYDDFPIVLFITADYFLSPAKSRLERNVTTNRKFEGIGIGPGVGYQYQIDDFIIFPQFNYIINHSRLTLYENIPTNLNLTRTIKSNLRQRNYTTSRHTFDIGLHVEGRFPITDFIANVGIHFGYRFDPLGGEWKYEGDLPLEFPEFKVQGVMFGVTLGVDM